MTELEARVAVLEEKVFGISYPRAKEVVERIAKQAASTTPEGLFDLLGMGDPEYERATKLIREVKRYMGEAK